jgi:hypothetical protein
MYACEIYACEMHAYEMHAHEMHAHEIHTCQMLPGIPELFLGAFLLLGKTPPFPGTLKQFLGISIAPKTSSVLVRDCAVGHSDTWLTALGASGHIENQFSKIKIPHKFHTHSRAS